MDPTRAFVPLSFKLGEAFQFDRSGEGLLVGGVFYKLQVAHLKLSASRAFRLVAYPGQGHKMLFDAHQRTEALACGALIPADLPADLSANASIVAQISEQKLPAAASHQALAAIKTIPLSDAAAAVAKAAHRLDTLRNNWLNPPEWTVRVPEVVPLGMDKSPYPNRIEPRAGLSEADAKALQKRTLTNLYNQRPAWLAQAHAQLDAAVAAAYGWADYNADMADDEILRRLLALNLQRTTRG